MWNPKLLLLDHKTLNHSLVVQSSVQLYYLLYCWIYFYIILSVGIDELLTIPKYSHLFYLLSLPSLSSIIWEKCYNFFSLILTMNTTCTFFFVFVFSLLYMYIHIMSTFLFAWVTWHALRQVFVWPYSLITNSHLFSSKIFPPCSDRFFIEK